MEENISDLYLVRHGQASFGEKDYDNLSEKGVRQSISLGKKLKKRNLVFDNIVVGPMKRHIQTFNGINIGYGDSLSEPLIIEDFAENHSIIKNISNNLDLDEESINLFSALLSFSLENLILQNFSIDQYTGEEFGRKISADFFEIEDFTILDWGSWKLRNYVDKDSSLDIEVAYEYSDLENIIFDKSEIIKAAKNYDPNNFNIEKNYNIFFNMINSLGSGITKNITVKKLSTNKYIGGAKSIDLESLKFDYIDSIKEQKSLTEIDFNFNGLDLNIAEVSPEFSKYFTLMGYESVKFDFGTSWKWAPSNNLLNVNLNLGITDAADLSLKSSFTGLSENLFNINNSSALGAYLLSNFKLDNFELSLIDNSLKEKLFKLAAAESNITTKDLKREIINQLNTYTANASKNNLFLQYKRAIENFVNNSKKIVLQIAPESPISIAEVSPYFLTMNYDQIIKVLNLSISN